jgi:hypothetical protein
MKKKVAVIVRDRQGEALRMALGLTLADDTVDVYVLDRKVAENDENALNLEMIREMGMKMFSNTRENAGMEFLGIEGMANRLLEYDLVLPY